MGWRERGKPAITDWWGWRGAKSGGYCWFRRFATMQEKRLWDREFGRAKRSPCRLPDAYDDSVRTAQRSWKEHRETQWKAS